MCVRHIVNAMVLFLWLFFFKSINQMNHTLQIAFLSDFIEMQNVMDTSVHQVHAPIMLTIESDHFHLR